MILLLPLILSTLSIRFVAERLSRRGVERASAWASWPAAAAAGMGVVFLCTGPAHFLEPARSGLVAIVPSVMPRPDLIITASGLIELTLAVGLIVPRTRRPAAVASILLLLVLLPANVVAAAGVDHPAAPSTPLIPRLLLQSVFLAFAAAPLVTRAQPSTRTAPGTTTAAAGA